MIRLQLLRSLSGFAALTLLAVPGSPAQSPVHAWLTSADGGALLSAQPPVQWTSTPAPLDIAVQDEQRFQTIDGFGHTLTGGSAQLLMAMSPAARHSLLLELFGSGPDDVHTSYLRLSLGSSDMNDHAWTYDDLPAGATDPSLKHFSLAPDDKDVVPVLKEVLAIQPGISIVASPWSAPAWMKTNDALKGGTLQPNFYEVYANYFVKYLQAMRSRGIHITAVTPQNEPENDHNLPSMLLTAKQEAAFIGTALGPALRAAHLDTKIIAFDHNCDHPEYPEAVLGDPVAGPFTDGAGFHLYLGSITALTTVHDLFPSKNIYFTEQMVIPDRRHPEDTSIAQPTARILIGALRNWSRNVLLWNLAADSQNGPHTPDGGCPMCTGALTLNADHVTRLTAFYTAAHASKFVPPGSTRIYSTEPATADAPSTLRNVAFLTPDHHHVVIVSNLADAAQHFTISEGGHSAPEDLPARSVATYVW